MVETIPVRQWCREIFLIPTVTPQRLVSWGYFISLEYYSSEATEAFDLISLIRWGWVATWLGTWPVEIYSIRCCKAEQKMHLLLLWLRANHHVYLRHCPAGRITALLFASSAKNRPKSNMRERVSILNDTVNAVILLDNNTRFSYLRPFQK